VVAVREDAAALPAGYAIDGMGEARANRDHAASERMLVGCLDDQMRVVALEGVVDEAKPGPDAAGSKGLLDRVDDARGPQRRDARSNPKRHVRRRGFAEWLPSRVR